MIKNFGSKFRFLAARSFEQTVVYNKGVDTVIICQRLNCGSSFFGEQSCETKPVDPGIVQEAVKSVLGEGFPKRTRLLLHVHAAVSKYIAKLVLKDIEDGNAFFFLSIAFAEQSSDLGSAKI